MRRKLLELLCCPKCFGELNCIADPSDIAEADEIIAGKLQCSGCKAEYLIKDSIPRFVPQDNYAESFGYQWNLFSRTQLDSYNGTEQSANRFYSETGWTKESLQGKWILDAGCGAGRFLDVASQNECDVVGIDLSSAIDASRKNLEGRKNVHLVQASIYELPFRKGAFDGCYCIGVIQHTPDPQKTVSALPQFVKKDGDIVVTIYERKPWTYLFCKYWYRPVTRKMKKESLLRMIRALMPVGFAVSDVLFRVPVLGRFFQFVIPVANYVGKTDLSRAQRYDWAILDTFDMLSPTFDQPQTQAETESALTGAGVTDIRRLPNAGLNLIGKKS
ncbi:MAG TPA: methyltransferase domain-containing protein [Pyrinomonadaceae bacterium]|jgi:SAM-dependent methyltransferase|nr:methyltransferase domain-containing protein [Pyrinomonadaceae bacterium]